MNGVIGIGFSDASEDIERGLRFATGTRRLLQAVLLIILCKTALPGILCNCKVVFGSLI